jgi:DNA-binding Lrp family transcriptional regulator
MDEIDKQIIKIMLKDARTPQRRLAQKLNISPPAVSYRVNKLMGDVIKRLVLYVNPNFYGKYHGYASFSNLKDYEGEYIAKIRCIESENIYEIEGKNREDVKLKIDSMAQELGEPHMVYIPAQTPYNPSRFDLKLVSILKERPLVKPVEVAEELGVSSKTVRRHMRYMFGKNFFRLIPIVDLEKAGILMYAVFTKRVEIAEKFFYNTMIREISDDNAGIFVNVADNVDEISNMTIKFRKEFDPEASIMITSKYEFT